MPEFLPGKDDARHGVRPKRVLTRREREIISLLLAGHTNREIANKCAISEGTVKHNLTRLYHKLRIRNRLELALFFSRSPEATPPKIATDAA